MAKQVFNEGKTKPPKEKIIGPKKDIQNYGKTKPPKEERINTGDNRKSWPTAG